MPYPSVTVEIGFDDGPYVGSPTWTDVTSYVRSINVSRGRDSDTSNFESGTATLTLDNRDRRFDPFHTTGPYYGKLLPRRQIRIRGTISGNTYGVFRGFVSGWPVELAESGYDSTVTLSCFDLLGLLAEEELPDDLAGFYIKSLTPRHYWPLDDPLNPANTAALELRDEGSTPVPIKSFTQFVGNADGLAAGLPNTCVVNATTGASNRIVGTVFGLTTPYGPFTVALWWQRLQADDTEIALVTTGSQGVTILYNAATSTFTVQLFSPAFRWEFRNTAVNLDTSAPHHVVVVASNAGSSDPPFFAANTVPVVYIDGIQITMTYNTNTFFPLNQSETVWIPKGRYQQFAVFPSALTAAQVQTIYNLSANRVLETTFARFDRIIGYTSLPTSRTQKLGTAAYTVFDIGAGGPPITQELQLTADSEGGNLYADRDGVLTMTSRDSIFSGTSITSQATFGGSGGISVEPILRYRYDDENLINDLSVNYTGDGTINVQDATSISTYGQSSGSMSTYMAEPADAEDLADLVVGFSEAPRIALDAFRVNVAAVSADWQTVLDLELLERITVVIQQRTGANITTAQLVQAITHDITPGEWRTTITGSTRFTNPFILDSSLLDGPDLII